jgi:flagellar protein FlaG
MSINISASVSSNRAQVGPENKGPSVVETENNKATEEATEEAQQAEAASRQQAAAESRQAAANTIEAPAPEDINQAVSDINAYLQNVSRELQFRVDEALPLGRTVVSVIDTETKETIREFPSKEVLALARRLLEAQDAEGSATTEGLLFSDQA